MPRSTRLSIFPDINVWIALTYGAHIHHETSHRWFKTLGYLSTLGFCRVTQMGLLRLLTTASVMGDEVMTPEEAWQAYDRWREDDRVDFLEEPPGLEHPFRRVSCKPQQAVKNWTDSYLISFAEFSGSRLVTFDQALHRRTENSILLSP